ncbi:hypothetical protein [Streptomyces sp. NRRL WC-3742]|nr:hypothetical protein [Streptomyces sp. NRRL WC-3742]
MDALIYLHLPDYAHAAGPFYGDFHTVTDRHPQRVAARGGVRGVRRAGA